MIFQQYLMSSNLFIDNTLVGKKETKITVNNLGSSQFRGNTGRNKGYF